MNRLLFSALIFSLFGSPFAAAAEVDAHEVEEIVVTGKVQGNAPQKTTERMNVSGLGNGHLAESFSYSSGNFASVLFKATPSGRSSGRLMYAYQNDNPNTTRKLAAGLRTGLRIGLKLLGGTVGGIGAITLAIYASSGEWCDDNSPEDCGESKSTWEENVASAVYYSVGIAIGVSVWDRRDRPVHTLAGSLLGFGAGIAIARAWDDLGPPLLLPLLLPVITATAASEWSRNRPESRRYSLGLRPEPRGGLSVVAALRFQ